jgi:spore photoproduct lyase
MEPVIKQLIIERAAAGDPLTARIRSRLRGTGETLIDDPRILLGGSRGQGGTLFLMRHRGAFVKDFPTTPHSPPCGEKYIITMLNCPYACSYCYLQSYLDHGSLVLFTDSERMKEEVARSISRDAPKRITTGEMSDSLALDELTGTTLDLLPLFDGTGTLFEVRTKSSRIDHIVRASGVMEGRANLVITWTLGPAGMIGREESGTASLTERIEAMGRALRAGLRAGVRFDPVVPHYADMKSYGSLIGEIARVARGGRIDRFEIGALRFPPGLIERIRSRNPRSALLRGEYVRDGEGKLRLYRPARVAIYRELALLIRERFPGVPIELSMESGDVWEDSGIALPV